MLPLQLVILIICRGLITTTIGSLNWGEADFVSITDDLSDFALGKPQVLQRLNLLDQLITGCWINARAAL